METRAVQRQRANAVILSTACIALALSITNNASGSPQATLFFRRGTPAVSLSPTSLAFGSQHVGTTSTAQTVTLSNTGNAALSITSLAVKGTNGSNFAQTNTCGSSVAAGAHCTISVTFTPSASGSRTASVSITDNASGSPQTVSLSGTGTAALVSLSPTSLAFGNQSVGTTSTAQTLTLSNTGNAALSITSLALTGTNASDFAQTNTCGSSVAAGANCTISVTFTPSASGSRTASVSITDNASGSPQTVSLSGTGTAPVDGLSPTSLAFGNQSVGTTSTAQTVTLSNTGNAALSITSLALTGTNASDFAQTNTCGSSVAAGANCTISVTFTPAASGSRTASVSITDNASGSPQSVNLTGTGSNPQPSLTSLSPASTVAGAAAQTLTLAGTNFLASSTVTYNGVGHAATFVSSTQLSIGLTAADQAAAGTYAVVVTNPAPGGGTSSPLNFAINNPAPTLTSLSPTSGPEGTLVTIVGANFGTAQGTVNFNGTAAPVTSWSPSTIMVAVPAGATSGNVVVTAGGVASNGVNFTVLPLQLPSQAQVLAAIENVNNYWISNNAAGNSDWDQATYFTGDLAAYDATGQANYLSFAQSWATENSYSLTGGNTTTWPDYQAAGQVYIRLYQLSNNSSDLSGITESINGMVNSTVDNEWTWIDAINMSMPDFAELGSINNNTNYYTTMYALYSYAKYTLGLYDPTTGLWWENSTYANTSTYWSRGNGWVFAAHAKVLSVLPTSDPHYAEYLSTFITMAQALAARQQPGGYWNSDLGGTDYAGPESSGTSFFLYGLAWGLNNGILDQNTYLPVVEKAWNFLANTAIQPSGLLGYVQQSTASNGPGPTSATTTFDYGVGAFLLAGRQMALLTVLPNPVPTLTSLSPTSAVVGAASQTLTLTGTNFLASSTVTYNAVGHAATFVSSTQLTIGLTAADQATAGSYAVVVTNPAPGGGASSPLNFAINNPAPGPTAPTLTSLSPASAVAGAGAQTLTLTGTNFLASSTVTYNGVGHAATFVSSTQLTIGLTAADQATAGSYAVVVTNRHVEHGTHTPLAVPTRECL